MSFPVFSKVKNYLTKEGEGGERREGEGKILAQFLMQLRF
jgi:hypothetical protein